MQYTNPVPLCWLSYEFVIIIPVTVWHISHNVSLHVCIFMFATFFFSIWMKEQNKKQRTILWSRMIGVTAKCEFSARLITMILIWLNCVNCTNLHKSCKNQNQKQSINRMNLICSGYDNNLQFNKCHLSIPLFILFFSNCVFFSFVSIILQLPLSHVECTNENPKRSVVFLISREILMSAIWQNGNSMSNFLSDFVFSLWNQKIENN